MDKKRYGKGLGYRVTQTCSNCEHCQDHNDDPYEGSLELVCHIDGTKQPEIQWCTCESTNEDPCTDKCMKTYELSGLKQINWIKRREVDECHTCDQWNAKS